MVEKARWTGLPALSANEPHPPYLIYSLSLSLPISLSPLPTTLFFSGDDVNRTDRLHQVKGGGEKSCCFETINNRLAWYQNSPHCMSNVSLTLSSILISDKCLQQYKQKVKGIISISRSGWFEADMLTFWFNIYWTLQPIVWKRESGDTSSILHMLS